MATTLALREDTAESLAVATGGAADSVGDSISAATDETRAPATASGAATSIPTEELPVETVGGDAPLSPAEAPTSDDVVPVAESPPPTIRVSAEDVDAPEEREKESAAAPREDGSHVPVAADVASVGGEGGSGGEAAVMDETVLHKWGPCLCEEGADCKHHTVTVESRMWPGINKPGGVGRITKRCVVVEEKYGEKVPIAFYSVKYLLGGSEKNVRETYISCTQEDGEARKVLPRDIYTVPVEENTRRQKVSPGPLQLQRPTAKRAKGPGEVSSKPDPRKSLPSLSTTCSGGSVPAQSLGDRESSRENSGGASTSAKPPKRSRLDDTGDGNRKRTSCGKQAKSSRDNKENSEAHAHVTDDAAVAPEQKIVYLTEQVVHKKAACPLKAERMAAFRAALPLVFGSSPDESMAMGTFKSRMNEHVAKLESAQSAFDDEELKKGLSFLEEENKVLVAGNGDIYLI